MPLVSDRPVLFRLLQAEEGPSAEEVRGEDGQRGRGAARAVAVWGKPATVQERREEGTVTRLTSRAR